MSITPDDIWELCESSGTEQPVLGEAKFDPYDDGGRVVGEIVSLATVLERSDSKPKMLKAMRKMKKILNGLDL